MFKQLSVITKFKPTRWLGILLLSLSLTACQLPFSVKDTPKTEKTAVKVAVNSGIGGTGKTDENSSGFGGTGMIAKESGFGGTGVIGTITEFGSIWVNGIEIEYPENVKVSSNLLASDQLRIGQQVIVETVIDKTIPWTENIRVYYPLAGKIEKSKDDHIVVDGKIVYLSKNTQIANGLELTVGNYVAVNGYPNLDKSWNATLLSHNPNKKHFYHEVPKANFSDNVKKLYIETRQSQLKVWDNQFGGLPINLIQTGKEPQVDQHYLLTAQLDKGKITRYQLEKHAQASGKNRGSLDEKGAENSSKKHGEVQIKKPQASQILREAQDLKTTQQMLQNQAEQVNNLKHLKEAIEQMKTVNEIKKQFMNTTP